ncbi:2OG-Fe(II) oxygenase superfamily-domain-containing protein [Pelagophyceae sp. CCMP2097]|nr:2OG-Fe(II) oxygenase superfamily-domain-containing protein [Pelagophyceae sp. CCMP2097]
MLAPAVRRSMLQSLEKKAYFVCDLDISKANLDALRIDVESLQHEPGFFNAAGQAQHRGDRIGWIGKRGAEERRLPRLASALKFMLVDLPSFLPQTPAITGPAEAMLSLYDGGAAYAPHRDGVADASFSGVARSAARALLSGGVGAALSTLATATSPVAHRELTTILYLNPSDWDLTRDGGALRLFGGAEAGDRCGETATGVLDVSPLGGRLVVFESRRVLHAVLPATRRRLACTAWHLDAAATLGAATAANVRNEW